MEIENYEIEKRSGSTTLTLIEHLETEGFIESVENYYVVKVSKVGNPALGKGENKTTGDVYVIEKENLTEGSIAKVATVQESDVKQIIKVADTSTENENYILRYYKTSNEYKDIYSIVATTATEVKGDITEPQVLAQYIKTSDYGDKIEFSGSGVTDWSVFYNDGTNVYIIPTDVCENSSVSVDGNFSSYVNKIISGDEEYLNIWVSSWNQLHPDRTLKYREESWEYIGYIIEEDSFEGEVEELQCDGLFCSDDSYSLGVGYPSGNAEYTYIWVVIDGKLTIHSLKSENHEDGEEIWEGAYRPIIALKTDAKGIYENGTWKLVD